MASGKPSNLLFVAALLLGSVWELPTIDEKWGTKLNTTITDGNCRWLRSVKCYGVPGFSAQLQNIPGL